MTQSDRQPVEAQISGLKCDTATCNYRDDTITVDQYVSYVNAPCPKCGASLLTPEDFETVQHSLLITEFLNGLSDEELDELAKMPFNDSDMDGTATLTIELDGTGDVGISIATNDPKEGENE